jgi:hypothetical protein
MSPSIHPALSAREDETRALADAVRRLIALAVTNDAPAEVLVEVAAALSATADRLEPHVPQVPVSRLLPAADHDEVADDLASDATTLERAMPYDMVIGACNPVAPPVRLHFEPPKAIGVVTFGAPYEGAPGCVHGAALAATFDIVLTAANVVADATGPTVRLNLRYRRPTLLGVETRFEAWVTSCTERRVHSLGRLVQQGEVTLEAEGEFAVFDHSRVEQMAASRSRRQSASDA